jgi:hypothetical protein
MGDCEKTISFFTLAEEKGLVDLNDLEVSMILSECYVSLAEKETKDNNLAMAASYYLKAQNIWKIS